MSYTKPLPKIDALNKGFWDNARAGKLSVHECAKCGNRRYPATPSCPNCLSPDQRWAVVSGNGTLESWVDFHRAYWDGFSGDLPYRCCLVRLDEGPLMISNLVDAPDNLKMGARVTVVFEPATDTVMLPKFKMA